MRVAAKNGFGLMTGYHDCQAELALLRTENAALQRSASELSAFLGSVPCLAFLKDAAGRYVFINPAGEELLGLKARDCLGRTDLELWPAELASRLTAGDSDVLASGKSAQQLGHFCWNGTSAFHLTTKFPVVNSQGDVSVGGLVVDVTESRMTDLINQRHTAVMQMIARKRPLREILEQIEALLQNLQPHSRAFVLVRGNSTLEALSGSGPAELSERLSSQLLPRNGLAQHIAQPEQDTHFPVFSCEIEDSSESPAAMEITYLPVRSAAGHILGAVAWCTGPGGVRVPGFLEALQTVRDLALVAIEQNSLHARIQQDAEYDALTGLLNRYGFCDRLDRAVKRACADPCYSFAVLSIDLDRFQRVNDSMGHLAGDQLLQGIAQRIASTLRKTDAIGLIDSGSTIARFGGDEFAVILDEVQTLANATQVCDRVQHCLAAPFFIEGREVFAAASIGIVLSASSYLAAEDMLRDSGIAMNQAKALGKARYQVFDAEMRHVASVRWQLETDLRYALERREMQVYYQPKVVVSTGEIAGFEALLRWAHPTRGLISPLQFIPIAEETGLIVPIGNWVLREACRQLREWNDRFASEPPRVISVNLSCCQFNDSSLFDDISRALTDTRLEPRYLSLEITESNLMVNAGSAVEVLDKLKAIGVELMIDDFGTGYSSLNYLARFPFDTLKIDQSFVRAMELSVEGVEMIKTMLALAGNLSMDVVAEGIETDSQRVQLQALGCQWGQGYLFSKPVPANAVEVILTAIANSREKPVLSDRESVGGLTLLTA